MTEWWRERLQSAAGVNAHLHRVDLGKERKIEDKLLGGGGHVVDERQFARLAYHARAGPAPLVAAGVAAIEVETASREGGGVFGGADLPECGAHGNARGVGLERHSYACRHAYLEVLRRCEALERCGVDAVVGVGSAWHQFAHKGEL